ncbi:hypothetical protein ACE6H2_015718 [Prunus campanulata]
MPRLNLWAKSKVGHPSKPEINKMREKFRIPDDVTIGRIPKGADMYTGVGIPEGALVLSPSHLEFIRFPLHPLFHLVLNSLNLHPMQLNPNSYLLISGMLVVGLKWGVSLGFLDFFYHHYVATVRCETEYFYLTPRLNRKFFGYKPSSAKDWKTRPLMITGNWAAPEMSCVSIPSSFGPEPSILDYDYSTDTDSDMTFQRKLIECFLCFAVPNPTRLEIVLAHERIQWLNRHLVGRDWDVQHFLDRSTLLRISQDRDSIIYRSYLRVDLSADLHETELVGHIVSFDRVLQFEEDSSHRIRRSYTERQAQEEEDSGGYSPDESELSDMSGPLPNPSKRASRPGPGQRPSIDQQTKRSERVPNAGLSSDLADACIPGSSSGRSHHDVPRRVGLATSAPLSAAEDTDLDNEPIIPTDGEIWRPKFQRSYGKRLTTNEGLLHDSEACDAVLGGLLHPRDIKEQIDLDDRDIALQQAHHLISMAELRLVELSRAQGRKDELDNLSKSHEHLGQRLKASEAASAKQKGEISRLSDKIEALNLERKDALLKMEQLKNDMGRVENEKKDQYDACCSQIFKESAIHFRFGWVQGQQPTHHRVVADPDAYDGEMGIGVTDYEFIFGMIPTDIPPLGSAEHHAPPDSGDIAPSAVSHDISVRDYEIRE